MPATCACVGRLSAVSMQALARYYPQYPSKRTWILCAVSMQALTVSCVLSRCFGTRFFRR
eukprot:2910023-Rhodomonas_salina.7